MLTRGVVTPFEALSTQKRLRNELHGLERYKSADNCVTGRDYTVLLTKCIDIKLRELSIIRKVLAESKL